MKAKPCIEILIVTRAVDGKMPLLDGCINRLIDCTSCADYSVSVFVNGWQGQPFAVKAWQSSFDNTGFIAPNNALCKNLRDYTNIVVLLNDDVEVGYGWDAPLIAALLHDGVGAVGYSGGYLDPNTMVGSAKAPVGPTADYIEGWCLAMRRDTVERVQSLRNGNLFDAENLSFAYGEDSDLCLFLRELGYQNYVLPDLGGKLIKHLGSQTTHAIVEQLSKNAGDPNREQEALASGFVNNHEYLKKRWGHRVASRAGKYTFAPHQFDTRLAEAVAYNDRSDVE